MPSLLPIIANYTFHEIRGTGTFGTVYRAVWDGRLDCAVKIFNKAAINEAYVSWCLEKLRQSERNPQIIPILGFDLAQEPAYAASSWVEPPANGISSLEDAAGKWSFSESGKALVALAGAMAWLHERGIIHTGITSGNVLMLNESPQSVCVTDVGQGLIDANQLADWSAHAPFLSPERCRYEAPHGESSGEAWDVYAFGMVSFRLLTGRKHARALDYFKKISKQKPNAPGQLDLGALAQKLGQDPTIAWRSRVNSEAEEALRKLVERCLALSLEERYGHMRDVLADLEKIDFANLNAALQTAPVPAAPKSVRAQRKPSPPNRKPIVMPELGTLPEPATEPNRASSPSAPNPSPSPRPDREPRPPSKALAWAKQLPERFRKSPRTSSEGPAPSKGVLWAAAAAALLVACLAGWQFRKRQASDLKVVALQNDLEQLRQQAQTEAAAAHGQVTAAHQAVSEQQRLRLNLRQEQELGDMLLETLLDQRPSEEHELEVWRTRLNDYTAQANERLKNMGQDPTLREASARTRWNMAGIAQAVGESQAASGWLDEALREVEAAAAATTSKDRRLEWDLLSGKIQSRRGEISLTSNLNAEAIQRLTQAIQGLQAYLQAMPGDFTAQREYARALWMLGKAQIAKPDPTAALASLNLSSETATQLILSPAQRDSDVLLFVDAFHDLGRAYIALKQDENALKSYLQPMQKLRDWDREHPQSEAGRSRLAAGYLAMGRILARGAEEDRNPASKALNQGIRLLLDLTIEHPENESYIFELGVAYGDVADMVAVADPSQKTTGAKDALPYALSGVNYFQILTEKNFSEPKYRDHYAVALTRVAEFQADISKFADAVKTALQAEKLLEDLEREEGRSTEDQARTRHSQLRVQEVLGLTNERLTRTADAVAAYQQAVALGQKITATEPENQLAQQALTRAQENLGRLKK